MNSNSLPHNLPRELRAAHERIISILKADTRLASGAAIEQLCFLIFLKILDEEAVSRESQLQGAGNSLNTAPLFPAQAERFRWSRWCGKSGTELHNFLRDDVFPYMGSLVREDPQVADYFRDAMLEIAEPDVLKQIIDELGQIEFTRMRSAHAGGFFELVLDTLGHSRDGGQFYSPPIVHEIMVALLDPKPGDTINDLACGTGSLLVEALKYKTSCQNVLSFPNDSIGNPAFQNTNTVIPPQNLCGNDNHSENSNRYDLLSGADISRQMVRIATMNLILHGIRNPRITRANTLSIDGGLSEEELNRKYSIILCDPPIGMQVPRGALRQGMPTDVRKSELLFAWMAMESLEPGGRAAIILPEAALSATTTMNMELRKRLVEDFDLLAVVSLPPSCFKPVAAFKAAIVLFRRPSVHVSDKIDQTIFCELEDDASNYLDFIKNYCDADVKERTTPDVAGVYCSLATRKVIAANGYNFMPGQYKQKSSSIHTLQPAPTLKDLRDRIDEAIDIAGEDATWNGFDDEAIYIYHPTDSSKWVVIFPGDRKKP